MRLYVHTYLPVFPDVRYLRYLYYSEMWNGCPTRGTVVLRAFGIEIIGDIFWGWKSPGTDFSSGTKSEKYSGDKSPWPDFSSGVKVHNYQSPILCEIHHSDWFSGICPFPCWRDRFIFWSTYFCKVNFRALFRLQFVRTWKAHVREKLSCVPK